MEEDGEENEEGSDEDESEDYSDSEAIWKDFVKSVLSEPMEQEINCDIFIRPDVSLCNILYIVFYFLHA